MNQKGFINIILVIITVALVGLGAYFVSTRQVASPTPTPTPTPTQQYEFKRCNVGTTWGCRPVTQGIAPDPNNPPSSSVCGCLPTCASGKSLVVSLGEEIWPDGTSKGGFACSYNLPP